MVKCIKKLVKKIGKVYLEGANKLYLPLIKDGISPVI